MTQESSTAATPTIPEMPTDPNQIEAWATQASQALDVGTTEPEAPAAATAPAAAAPAATDTSSQGASSDAKPTESKADPVKTDQPDGVLAKDGKTVIPYSVLANTRQQEAEARRVAAAASAQAERLQRELDELKAGKAATDNQQTTDEIVAQIEQLTESVPEVAGPMKALVAQIQAQSAQIAELRKTAEQAVSQRNQVDDEADPQSTVQSIIDQTPKLLYAQNGNPQLWERVVREDNLLREDPEFKGLSLKERFDKAVSIVEARYGVITVPAEYLPPPREEKVNTEVKPAATPAAPAAPAAPRPMTLSDLPGGIPPTRSDRRLDEQTTMEAAQYVDALIAKGLTPQELALHLGTEALLS